MFLYCTVTVVFVLCLLMLFVRVLLSGLRRHWNLLCCFWQFNVTTIELWDIGMKLLCANMLLFFFSGILFWSLKEFSCNCLYKNFLKLKRVQCWYHEISFPFFFLFFVCFCIVRVICAKEGVFSWYLLI